MIIGIDLDNTIACYDNLFHHLALQKGLIPTDHPPGKTTVRDYLRKCGNEEEWIKLQGEGYGPGMVHVPTYPGFLEFLQKCREFGFQIFIVSHKTEFPFRGPKYNLHDAAREWLESRRISGSDGLIPKANVFLETTKEAKWNRISELGCDLFIDDLPEILSDPLFPIKTLKILFDPERQKSVPSPDVLKVSHWDTISQHVATPHLPLKSSILKLLPNFKHIGQFDLIPLPGGANNRAFHATSEDQAFLVKQYYRSAHDRRDRLTTEYSFLSFSSAAKIPHLPEPIACDHELGVGIYSFIEGRRLKSTEIDRKAIEAALDLIHSLNAHRDTETAKKLPPGSEACFSLDAHLRSIENRVERLKSITGAEPVFETAKTFIEDELTPAFKREEIRAFALAGEHSIDFSEEASPSERCISPSDFGFHNALMKKDGHIAFIDFEYAGWDDAARMICDFFCQPEVPVPFEHFDFFLNGITKTLQVTPGFEKRVKILFPLYQIKWSCILLNEFLPKSLERRQFSKGDFPSDRFSIQLEKARKMLALLR